MRHRNRMIGAVLAAMLVIACLAGCTKKPEPETEAHTSAAATAAAAQAAETKAPETQAKPETEAEPEVIPEEPVRNIGVHAGTVSEQINSEDSYFAAARVELPELELSGESAKEYPELDAALKSYVKDLQNTADAKLKRLSETYAEMAEARPEEKDQLGLCDETKPSVMRADSRILSIRNYTYAYYGGPHPDHSYSSANFDAETGKLLRLEDAITDMDAFTALVDKKVREAYPDLTDYFFSTPAEAIAALGTENSNMAWNLEYEGIRLIFNPYCLGPYAMGEQTVTVTFAEAKELLNPVYTETPDSWFAPLDPMLPTLVDTVGNGKPEAVAVTEEAAGDDGYAFNCTVTSGNRSCRLETWSYRQESYLLKANGQYYVYLFSTTDNDWVNLYPIDLKTMLMAGDVPQAVYRRYLRTEWHETAAGNAGTELKEALTDPDGFCLGTRVDYLGTQGAFRNYHVGKDGALVPETPYYTYENLTVLKVKQPLTVDTVDENGSVTGTAELAPDTYLFFVRTDDKTYVDLQEVNASKVESDENEWFSQYYTVKVNRTDWSKPVYRIREDKTQWPFTIDGKDEAEVLSGINYAG